MMSPAWVLPLGWALVHGLWQASALALLIRAAQPFLVTRPRLRYWSGLGALVLALVAMGATWTWQREASPVSVPASTGVVGTAAAVDLGPAAVVSVSRSGELVATVVERGLGALVLLWVFGGMVAVSRFARAVAVCRSLREATTGVDTEPVRDAFDRAARQLGIRRSVDLGESPLVDAPVLVGWWRPKVIVPPGLDETLSSDDLESLLAHELAHVARWDDLVVFVQTAIERAFFFHPALRWLSTEIRVAREHCCDDLAASASRGGAVGYARALFRLETSRSIPSMALGAADGDLRSRIERLVVPRPDRRRAAAGRHRVAGSVGALMVALALLAGGVEVARATTASTTVVDGLDPVLLVQGEERPGSPFRSLTVEGYRYLFASDASRERFLREPSRYTVRNVAACPITGRDVRPDVWRVVDGRIVLFCCPRARALPERLARVDSTELTDSN